MRETLEQPGKEKRQNDKREAKVVVFRVPESKKLIAKQRQDNDLSFFADFCRNGLQCQEITVNSAISIGESNANDQTNIKSRP